MICFWLGFIPSSFGVTSSFSPLAGAMNIRTHALSVCAPSSGRHVAKKQTMTWMKHRLPMILRPWPKLWSHALRITSPLTIRRSLPRSLSVCFSSLQCYQHYPDLYECQLLFGSCLSVLLCKTASHIALLHCPRTCILDLPACILNTIEYP